MDEFTMSIEIRVPALGESVTEGTVATWLKGSGETVASDEVLCELETDKVTVEIRSPASGRLGEIVAGEGSSVEVNALLATIDDADTAVVQPGNDPVPSAKPAADRDVENAPSARKLMAEHDLARDAVKGTGRDGRIMKEDVNAVLAAPAPDAARATPHPPETSTRPPAAAGETAREERVPMTRLRQTIARRLCFTVYFHLALKSARRK